MNAKVYQFRVGQVINYEGKMMRVNALLDEHRVELEPLALCDECGQPMKPAGIPKRRNEFDHAQGCPLAPKRRAKATKPGESKEEAGR